MTRERARFILRSLDELRIDDDRSFRHIGVYADLKDVLVRGKYAFRVLPEDRAASWDRAVFLNLTFWGADEGGDVLVDTRVPADVVTHIAWHHLAAKAFRSEAGAKPSVDALFLGEAIASAFDLYLVGRLLGHSPDSSVLASQVPAIADAAEAAGVSESDFDALLQGVAENPERAFEDLRALLVDATRALFDCTDAESALQVLEGFEAHRFGAILHRYELSNWVLYARAYGDAAPSHSARAVDTALREASDSIEWLTKEWVLPALEGAR